jgi:dnaD and phage-associated domain protein
MFENEKQNNKAVYELYMKSIGEISPVIKERLDDLVETYGSERVIVAVNTTAENGGNSIKYVETVAAGNLKKEVNQANGTNKRGGGTRKAQTKTDGTEVDWSKETGEWI